MESQQNLNSITRILKQIVGLQHIFWEYFFAFYQREAIKPYFRFLEIRQYCAEPAIWKRFLSELGESLCGIITQQHCNLNGPCAHCCSK